MSPTSPRRPYPSDVADDEWAFVAPYLALLAPDALRRRHDLRAAFNALRSLAPSGVRWRSLPHDFPPRPAVEQQARRWIEAGAFAAAVQDLRRRLRVLTGRAAQPTAALRDARVLPSSPASGARAGYSGAKRRTGAPVHAAVATLGSLLALTVTSAKEDERTPVAALACAVPEVTGQPVELADVDQGDTGPEPAAAAARQGIALVVVTHPEATRGCVLRPRRGVVERSRAWAARFRRPSRDCERLPSVLAGRHFLAFACLMLHQVIHLWSSP